MACLLKISEAGILALHATALLASEPGKHHSVHDMASVIKASEHHLAKVLQRLTKAGIVTSVRGPKGGFELAKKADNLSMLDVFEAVEGPIGKPDCLLGLGTCVVGNCMMGNAFAQINDIVKERLKANILSNFHCSK
jgi:Rrf2 family protein